MSTVTIAKSVKKNTVSKSAMKKKNTKKTETVETPTVKTPVVVAPVNITGKAITNIALLAKLRASSWIGNIRDKEATAKACVDAGIDAQKKVVSFRKKLATSPELKAACNSVQKLRMRHAALTRPWMSGGVGMLPSAMFTQAKEEFDALIAEVYICVEKLVSRWSQLIQNDRDTLKSLFDITDYPSADEIRSKFSASVEYMPVPTVGDFRVEGLSVETLTQLQNDMHKAFAERMKEGDRDLLQRLLDGDQPSVNDGQGNGLKRLLYKLTTPNDKSGDVRFKQNSLDNIREFAKLVSSLNIGGNATIDSICKKLDAAFAIDAETLRESETALNDKAAETKASIEEIESAMAGLL